MSSILGSRFVSGMTRVSIDLEPALYDNNNSVDTTTQQDGSVQWKVEGLVSKAPSLTARDGSVARESQFFSINGRPVELPKISRAISDAWRAFEGTKKRPACVLCFTLPNNEYDVNLSPDKREVLLTHQDAICSLIHAQLTKVWTSQNGGNFAADAVSVPQERPTEKVKTQPERAEMKSPADRVDFNDEMPFCTIPQWLVCNMNRMYKLLLLSIFINLRTCYHRVAEETELQQVTHWKNKMLMPNMVLHNMIPKHLPLHPTVSQKPRQQLLN